MHTKIRAFFDEHASPTHCSRSAVHDTAKPIGSFAACFQRQISQLRELLLDAETDSDLPDNLRGKLEFMHQTLDAADRISRDLVRAVREATAVSAQMDRVFADARQDIDRTETVIAAAAARGPKESAR